MTEGRRRNHKDFILWQKAMVLAVAVQLHLARQIGYLTESALAPVLGRLDEVGRLLNAVITGLRRREQQPPPLPPTP